MKVYQINFVSGKVLDEDFASEPLQLCEMFGFFIQAVVAGTPTGTFKLQCSADPSLKGTTPTHWVDVEDSSTAVSQAGTVYWNVTDVFYNWVRLVYTDGSSGASTATLLGIFNAKGV